MSQPSATLEEIAIDIDNDHQSATDPYWARVEALILSELDAAGDDEAEDAKLLRQTTAGGVLETAARHAGFVLGVEYCRRLMQAGGVH